MLLYVVLQLIPALPPIPPDDAPADSAEAPPASRAPGGTPPAIGDAEPPPRDLPRIASYEDLVGFLEELGFDAGGLIRQSREWYESRGFLGANTIYGVEFDDATERYYEAFDAASLRSLSQTGDIGAVQALAMRLRLTDPGDSLSVYRQAAALGSTSALVQIGGLLDSYGRLGATERASDPKFARLMEAIGRTGAVGDLRQQAFGYLLAAIRDGGPPIATPELLAWTGQFARELDERAVATACGVSVSILLDLAGARRAQGIAPINARPAAVFLTEPDLYQQLPCQDTVSPILPVTDLSSCAYQPVLDAGNRQRELWVCP